MQKQHEELAATLAKAEAQAKAIEAKGGNVQGVIYAIREAATLTGLRVAAYQTAAADAEAKAKADAEAKK